MARTALCRVRSVVPSLLLSLMALFLALVWSVSVALAADRGPINSGETKIGFAISAPSYLDTWTFEGSAGDRVLITAEPTSGSLDSCIDLYPPGGGEKEASSGLGDALDHQLQQTGLYTIVVYDAYFDDSGTYNITMLKIPGPVSSAEDPDGGPIASGETLSGAINVASDLDAFQIYGEAGNRLIVTCTPTSEGWSAVLTLYPPDSGAAEASVWAAPLDHQLQQTGLYTVVISDWWGSCSGTYNTTALKIPGPVSSSGDPDGGPIASGQTLSRAINAASDLDAYQIYGQAGDRVLITAEPTSGSLDSCIDLYPPGGGEKEASSGLGDALDHQLQQTGLYTIVVYDAYFDDSGTYNITMLKIPGPVSSAEDPDGGPIASGETLSGAINVASDLDAFQIYGEAGNRLIVTCTPTSEGWSAVLTLYPPDSGAAEASVWAAPLDHQLQQTGLYTVVISDWWGSCSGTYGISATKMPSTLCPGLYNPRPASEATVRHGGGSLKWSAVAGATGYDVYFGTDVITPLDLIGDDLPTPSAAMPPLDPGTVYYWHVVAHTAGGDIEGPYWWFETGMGSDTVGLYDQAAGNFYLRNANSPGPAHLTFRFGPSAGSWLPVVGDWDSHTSQTIGLYNPTTGTFYLRNANAGGAADVTFRFGPAPCTWLPIAGDWDGDGAPGVGLYNAATGTFYLRNSLSAGPADYTFRFGPTASAWLPIVGDWNNDQGESVGLFNPANGTFYLRNALSGGAADLTFRFGPTPSSWKPMAGDWNADGTDSIGLYNALTGTLYLRDSNTAGAADKTFRYGPLASTWKPIAGDWDGQ